MKTVRKYVCLEETGEKKHIVRPWRDDRITKYIPSAEVIANVQQQQKQFQTVEMQLNTLLP